MLATLVLGAIGGFTATWVMRSVALQFGIVSHPNPIVMDHRRPVQYLGGLGIILCASLAWLLMDADAKPIPWIAVSGFAAFGLLGLLDDLSPLQPLTKFRAQFAICVVVISAAHVVHTTAMPSRIVGRIWAEVFGSSIWLVAVVNAVNFIDVCGIAVLINRRSG